MLLCATIVGFSSCSKEEIDYSNSELIGKWGASYYENGYTLKAYITFNTNGTGTTEAIIIQNGTTISSATADFTFKLSGNTLDFTDDLGNRQFTFAISGETLTLENKSSGIREVYTRVY